MWAPQLASENCSDKWGTTPDHHTHIILRPELFRKYKQECYNKAYQGLLEFFKECRISGFEICCKTEKQRSLHLEIEIKFKIIAANEKELEFHMNFPMN